MVKDGKAYQYARWCVEETGGQVPVYVKRQARLWLAIADGRDSEAYVDETAYEKICRLLTLIIHPDLHCNMYEGLDDYAWFFIIATLCTMCREGTEPYEDSGVSYTDHKIRYYTTSLLEICRKNHKTFNSAVIFIVLMLTEPEFSRFFSVAPDLKLSSELQIALKKILKSSPLLCDEAEPAFKIMRSCIRCLLTDSEYIPLAYSQDKMDGKLPAAFLADEAGAMDDYPVEAMRSGQITLADKLGIIISTQYPNDNNVMLTEIDIAKKTIDRIDAIADHRYFALLYEPDDEYKKGEAWQTEDNAIYQSNPVAVTNKAVFKELVKKRTMAVLYKSKRENYLCKHNNILYKGLGVEGFIDIQKVKLCAVPELLEFWQGKRIYAGLDLSQTDDNTSVSIVCDDNGVIHAKSWAFIPAEKITEKSMREKVDYQAMIDRGECFACGGEVIDYGFVEQFIITLPERLGVELVQVGYDRYNAISTVQKLEENGIECVEIKQHSSVLHQPTKLLKESVLQKTFRYDENRLFEINFQNARCTEDTNKNLYVNKKKSTGKVDMVVSCINAIYLLQQAYLYGDVFVCQV
jgi:phage terminase large subunit-like protein